MFKHSLLMTLRSFQRNKVSFFINVLGLSTALASVILIFLWIHDEQSVDAFHKKGDSLYQVMTNYKWDNKVITMENTSLLLANALEKEFPEVTSATSIGADFIEPEGIFRIGEKTVIGKGIFASQNFFETFSFQLLYGDKNSILAPKEQVVISQSLAESLFDRAENAVGKIVEWDYKWSDGGKKRTLVVSGVFEDLEENTTFDFDALLPAELMKTDSRWAGDWSGGYANTFVELSKETNLQEFDKKIAKYLTTKLEGREQFTLFTQKFTTRYLMNPYSEGIQQGGRIVYVRLFALIALFILILAAINFMNLSTAFASRRMKEIGVKKVLGSERKSLIFQFLFESTFLTLLSVIIGICIVLIVMPYFNMITGKAIALNINVGFILIIIGLTLLTGLLSGSYPAFYLSRFKPVTVLRGKANKISGESWVRKGLVVFQFSLSVIFIIAVFIIHGQMDYLMDKNLGYNKDNILTFELKTNFGQKSTLLNQIEAIPGVEQVAFMSGSILSGTDNQGGFSWKGSDKDQELMFESPRFGFNFIETMGIELVQGRTFSKDFSDDISKIIINESAAKLMGFETPVGMIINHGSGKKEIIGVVKDFHYGSLHKKVQPLIIRFREGGVNIAVRLKSENIKASLDNISKVYTNFQPGYPFEFTFLDSDYQQLYEAEQRVSLLSKIFAGLVIIISCLGLFGLVTFTAQQRSKEIGIRKVLGASVSVIVQLLSKDFLQLILVAILFAVPVAWFVMYKWLLNFAYRIEISLWFFMLASLIVIGIALLTVSFQALKVAVSNPVNSLNVD